MNAGQLTGELRLLVMQLEDEVEFIFDVLGPAARRRVEVARRKPLPRAPAPDAVATDAGPVVEESTAPRAKGRGGREKAILAAIQPGEALLVGEIHARMTDGVTYACVGVTLITMRKKELVERSGSHGKYRYALPKAVA